MRCLASLLLLLMFAPAAQGASIYCELASLPVLPLASDLSEPLLPEELLGRVAESYRGLLEFGGEALLRDAQSLERFFDPVPGRDQRSVALNESLTKLGDWVLLEAEDHGLTQEQIIARLREVVRSYIGQVQEEQGRTEETRESRRQNGVVTRTGYVFERDKRFPELGEAYRDVSEMVWGDVVRNPSDGSVRKMNHADALRYCQDIGAELPSREDFIRLRQYMGARNGTNKGYKAQILPALEDQFYWTSSVKSNPPTRAYNFYAYSGIFYLVGLDDEISVRCVRRPEIGGVP